MAETHSTGEVWKDVEGLVGQYRISNLGRVFSVRRNRTLRLVPCGHQSHRPYRRVWIGGRLRFVHHLVLIAFVGPRPDGCEASHINGDGSDNRPENLEWSTHIDNNARRRSHGTECRGTRIATAKLTERDIPAIRRLLADGATIRSVARQYGVGYATISRVGRGEAWVHIAPDGSIFPLPSCQAASGGSGHLWTFEVRPRVRGNAIIVRRCACGVEQFASQFVWHKERQSIPQTESQP